MRDINTVIVHCSDSPSDRDYGVNDIRKWHLERGWSDVGYHYIIRRDGTVEVGRQETVQGAHCYGKNYCSIGICLIGRSVFTDAQFHSLEQLVESLELRYDINTITGHYTYSNKTCPNFNVERKLGIQDG